MEDLPVNIDNNKVHINRKYLISFDLGSVVPVLGTAVGAVYGGVIGFFAGTAVGAGVSSQIVVPDHCAIDLNEFIPNRDLGIIEDDDKITILNEVKRRNTNFDIRYLEIQHKDEIGATLVATKPSLYKTDSTVYVKYLIRRNLYDTNELLSSWYNHYNTTLTEIEREFREDYSTFTPAHKRTFIDNMNFKLRSLLHDLEQNIIIIKTDEYIKKLYNRVVALENDLAELKAIVEKSQNDKECAKVSVYFDKAKGATNAFESITKSFKLINDFLPKSAEHVPVIGYAFQAFSILNSIRCYLDTI